MDTILHQTKSAFEFNFLYVIESLDVKDARTGGRVPVSRIIGVSNNQ